MGINDIELERFSIGRFGDLRLEKRARCKVKTLTSFEAGCSRVSISDDGLMCPLRGMLAISYSIATWQKAW